MSICYVCGKLGTPSNPASVPMLIGGNPVNAHKSCAKREKETREPTARRVTDHDGALIVRENFADTNGEICNLVITRRNVDG